jgi:anti-sigma factor RsiW
MTDRQLHTLIAAYHDGELSPDDRRRVERLLRHDTAAAAELAELQHLRSLLRSGGAPEIPGDLLAHLHDRVDEMSAAPIVRITAWLTAAAAAVLLACSTLLVVDRTEAAPAAVDPDLEWAMQSGTPAEGSPESRITQWIVSTLE